MFIILTFTHSITYDNLSIVSEDGIPTLFGSEYTAKQYAEEHCRLNYKIVKL